MLGLGWMLGFFTVGAIAPYFQFAFIIVNGIQVSEFSFSPSRSFRSFYARDVLMRFEISELKFDSE